MMRVKINKGLLIGILGWYMQLGLGQPLNLIAEQDSLTKLLPTLVQDTNRIETLYKLAQTWNSKDANKSVIYINEGISLSQKLNDQKRITDGMIHLGYVYTFFGKTTKGIPILQEAYRLTEKVDKHKAATAITFIAHAYQNQEDWENALSYAVRAYNMYEEERQSGVITNDYIGSPMTLGRMYLLMGQIDSAFFYVQKSYDTMRVYGNRNRYFAFHVPYLLGQIYAKRKDWTQASKYIQEGLEQAKKLDDYVGICEGQFALANLYNLTNQSDSVVVNALSALKIAQELKIYKLVADVGTLLKTWYQQHHDSEKALYYNDIANAAKDSLINTEKIKQGQLFLFQEEQYQQNLEAEKTAYLNRLMLYGLIAGLCVLALLAWVFYLNFKRKQKETLLLSNEIKLQETAFNTKLVETEMTALRAQMNPHFIFNCLNSIKLHTLENKPLVASDYLTKFSKLIRLVLENSRSEKVTLANELDMLQLYMEMEAMRFKDKMQFKINIEEDLDTHFIEIPPLLLQPYIENAIWHGLMHKEEGGSVVLDIKTKGEQMLQVSITDDGIGRKAAAELKSKTATQNKSFGLKMTSERIGLINQLYKSDTQVQIEDLIDSKGNAKGTKVTIEIPI